AHHRSRDLEHEIAPGAAAALAVYEFVGEPDAADEGERAVDDQELAMIPQTVLQALSHGERIEESQMRPRGGEPAPIRGAQSQGAKGVEEHVNPYPTLHATRERVDESPHHGAGVDEIHLEQDRLARRVDGLEHPPEDPVTVGEQVESIPLPPGP